MPKIAKLVRVSYPKIRHINIVISEITYRENHIHSEVELLAVLRGRADIRVGTRSFALKQGEFAVFNTREAHLIDGRAGQPLALILQYSPYLCREYYPHARRMIFQDPNASACLDEVQNQALLSSMLDAAQAYFDCDRLFELRCLSGLLRLMAQMGAWLPCAYLNPEQHHRRLDKAKKLDIITAYMEEKYQSPLRLEEVAAMVEMTPTYLSHFFRENVGVSFQTYLSELRFENALRVMDRSLPLKDIALGSGFSDPKYLNRMFQKKLGCTPVEYRRQMAAAKADARLRPRFGQGETQLSEAQSAQVLEAFRRSTQLPAQTV